MQVNETELKDFLFDSGLLSRKDIDYAARAAGERSLSLTDTLVHSGILSEDALRRALSRMLGIPFVRLTKNDVSTEALVLLPEAFSRAHNAVAFEVRDGTVE